MTSLESRLRLLSERGEPRAIDETILRLERELELRSAAHRKDGQRSIDMTTMTETAGASSKVSDLKHIAEAQRPSGWPRLGFAAALLAVAVAGGAVLASRADDATSSSGAADQVDPGPAAQTDPRTAIGPALTLPPVADRGVPYTLMGAEPNFDYRLTPDVEIGWNQPEGGDSVFCWRTPIEDGCLPDVTPMLPLILPTAPEQSVVVIWGNRTTGALPSSIEITLVDGSSVSAPVGVDPDVALGHARFDVEQGSIQSVSPIG